MNTKTGASHCPPRSILVGVDFGDASARALALAGVMASGFKTRLRVIHAERFDPPAYFTVDQIAQLEAERRETQAAATEHLAQVAIGAAGYPAEAVVVDAPSVEAILSESASADLIVLGTHGRRGPGRWWLGSVAERVVRAATVPVLVTRAASATPVAVFERLALVQDGSDADGDARRCAEALATLANGTITVAGPLDVCDAAALKQASLVVMATPRDRASWAFADAVGTVLGACDRPVLFIRPL